jgi:hypothetical protein
MRKREGENDRKGEGQKARMREREKEKQRQREREKARSRERESEREGKQEMKKGGLRTSSYPVSQLDLGAVNARRASLAGTGLQLSGAKIRTVAGRLTRPTPIYRYLMGLMHLYKWRE